MEYLKSIGKSLYVGFLDYEKAFDFVNRANIIEHLKEQGAGSKFTKAVAAMYKETFYIPKLCNKIGKSISAKHGVIQGRQTSTSFFSFEVHKMPDSVNVHDSIINNFNLLQLADDTALLSEEKAFLCVQFEQCFKFSARNYMFPNVDKTYFLHLADVPDTEPIILDESSSINSAINNEYVYLGMKFIASDSIVKHIKKNLADRMFHVNKFYDWLHVNESTPIIVKIQVLYTCMFNAYLYGSETWWKIDELNNQLLLLERKILKTILCVKNNTPDDILYLELNKHDIVASIKQRQYSFFKRLLALNEDEAVVRKIVSFYRNLPICNYYDTLAPDIITVNKSSRYDKLQNGTSTYIARYRQLIDPPLNHVIYDSYLPEDLRKIITRWRLSSHRLKIETGRQEVPFLHRNLRLCSECTVLEDEQHVMFYCPRYARIRLKYTAYLRNYSVVEKVFNPVNKNDALLLGNYLHEIEKCREALGLQ